ncbi:hypothetical protein CL620_06480 [archaeon]|nr:hypothetical protein [archaeon]|tara:strand:+ start:824 stop:1312 length:489 start_codon:yes stop_codon:yes gene_type:complete
MDNENDYLLDAREELKRLEHIIFVSLKYTRTVDVIINALNRMVSTFDYVVEGFLHKALEEGTIESIPKSPALRARRVAEMHADDLQLQKYLTYYRFLKEILKLPHEKREEYRRHVTYIVALENSTAEIKIDNLTHAEKYMHEFLRYTWNKIMGEPEQEEKDL